MKGPATSAPANGGFDRQRRVVKSPVDASASGAENQRHHLGTRCQLFLECTAKRAGDKGAFRLVDASNGHAAMACLDDHGHALDVLLVHQEVGQVFGQPFLQLRDAAARTSTTRGIFDRPITLPLGM